MADPKFIVLSFGGGGTQVSIPRKGKTIPLTESVDYGINEQGITFHEGVLSPLPGILSMLTTLTKDAALLEYPLTISYHVDAVVDQSVDMHKMADTQDDTYKHRILVINQLDPNNNGVKFVDDATFTELNKID
jgi:hypothetical protein